MIELAARVGAHQPDVICGPMTGGALLAELIADQLTARFAFAQRTLIDGRAHYTIPGALVDVVQAHAVAVVDDAISAGSAVGGTVAAITSCGGRVVALGALILVSDLPHRLSSRLQLPLEWLVQLDAPIWPADECPQCRQGEPVRDP